jgi:hypothetical protein
MAWSMAGKRKVKASAISLAGNTRCPSSSTALNFAQGQPKGEAQYRPQKEGYKASPRPFVGWLRAGRLQVVHNGIPPGRSDEASLTIIALMSPRLRPGPGVR